MPKHEKIFIATDGGSRGNPGPSAYGYGIYDEKWNILAERTDYIGKATNNEAEYHGIVEALKASRKFTDGQLEHYSDSQLIVRQLNGEYQIKADNLKPLARQVFKLQNEFESVIHVHLSRKDIRIARIDGLLNIELDEAMKREKLLRQIRK